MRGAEVQAWEKGLGQEEVSESRAYSEGKAAGICDKPHKARPGQAAFRPAWVWVWVWAAAGTPDPGVDARAPSSLSVD